MFSLAFEKEAPAVIPPLGPSFMERLGETWCYWRSWIARSLYSGPYQRYVWRSALTLKLMSYAPSGAVVAAPTTSLPEGIGGVRNWDYRYCWLRDAALTTRALVSLGFYDEAFSFLSWLLHSTRLTRPKLQVMYSVYGHAKLKERELTHLGGYKGSQPVRVGNGAVDQLQMDIYGEVLSAAAQLLPHIDRFDRETEKFIRQLGDSVMEMWDCPDQGIWEVRTGAAHHTHSKVMEWVAMDRLCQIAGHFRWNAPLHRYEHIAKRLREVIERQGYNEEIQSYVSTLGGDRLDAALLVMPLFGYCEAGAPRMRATCRAIVRDLGENGLIYRYRAGNDGLPGQEGSFGICNFWLAENLARAGNVEAARAWFESLLKRDNATGLWSEEIDPRSGEFLGNYPQAFTHVGLINAATTLKDVSETRGAKVA